MNRADLRKLCPSCQEKFPQKRRKLKLVTRERREKKRLSRKELVAAVRPVVEKRAGGQSELSGAPFGEHGFTAEWDEFYGRRPEDVTVEKTWMLTRAEHDRKSRNFPTREWWDEAFREHCEAHGYPFVPRATKQITRRG